MKRGEFIDVVAAVSGPMFDQVREHLLALVREGRIPREAARLTAEQWRHDVEVLLAEIDGLPDDGVRLED